MKIYRAVLETRNFDFEAYHTDEEDAILALREGLKKHCRQYSLNFGSFMSEFEDDINVRVHLIGGAYRDRSPL